jgi:hypothetical protein
MALYKQPNPRLYQKVEPVRDERARAAWAKRHRLCAACGVSDAHARLHVHHLVKFSRSDEPANLLSLCGVCHSAAEGVSVVWHGGRLPMLSFAHCLALKQAADPDEWQPGRLTDLLGRPLPQPEPVPRFYRDHFHRRQGRLPEEFLFGYSLALPEPERGA